MKCKILFIFNFCNIKLLFLRKGSAIYSFISWIYCQHDHFEIPIKNVDFIWALYTVCKQLHTFSLHTFSLYTFSLHTFIFEGFFFIDRLLQVSLTSMQTIFLIHMMFANNLFCLFRPCKQFFSIFFIPPPSRKIMVRPLGCWGKITNIFSLQGLA